MDDFKLISDWIFMFWFITIPLSIWIIYTVITELLDLIFNTGTINKMLKQSDNLNVEAIENQYKLDMVRQSKLNYSNLREVKRQTDYVKIQAKRNDIGGYSNHSDKLNVIAAKNLSDFFRVD